MQNISLSLSLSSRRLSKQTIRIIKQLTQATLSLLRAGQINNSINGQSTLLFIQRDNSSRCARPPGLGESFGKSMWRGEGKLTSFRASSSVIALMRPRATRRRNIRKILPLVLLVLPFTLVRKVHREVRYRKRRVKRQRYEKMR